jgi:hypothetical protein
MITDPQRIIAKLKSLGIESPAFDQVFELLARPFLPSPPPGKAGSSIGDISEAMAIGQIEWSDYERYLFDAAIRAAKPSTYDMQRALDQRKAHAHALLATDGANIGRQLRALAHEAAEQNRAAHRRLEAAGVTDEKAAFRSRETAADWAERGESKDRHLRLIAYLNELISEGVVPLDAVQTAQDRSNVMFAEADARLAEVQFAGGSKGTPLQRLTAKAGRK